MLWEFVVVLAARPVWGRKKKGDATIKTNFLCQNVAEPRDAMAELAIPRTTKSTRARARSRGRPAARTLGVAPSHSICLRSRKVIVKTGFPINRDFRGLYTGLSPTGAREKSPSAVQYGMWRRRDNHHFRPDPRRGNGWSRCRFAADVRYTRRLGGRADIFRQPQGPHYRALSFRRMK